MDTRDLTLQSHRQKRVLSVAYAQQSQVDDLHVTRWFVNADWNNQPSVKPLGRAEVRQLFSAKKWANARHYQKAHVWLEMMNAKAKVNRAAVRRYYADSYLLTSLVAFGVTVVAVRLFLQLTGFPQIGNSVLHIAHALWGALLLFIAVLLPLIFANRWAIQVSALLSGVGIGLFIDEVGKFITQKNDYFFPPALPLIYGFFLLTVFLYLYFRKPRQEDPRKAIYHALEGLQDILDDDLDLVERAWIETKLAIARHAQEPAISALAETLSAYVQTQKEQLKEANPGFWRRTARKVDEVGPRLGRKTHRRIISVLLLLWSLSALLTVVVVAFIAFGGVDLQDEVFRASLSNSELSIVDSGLWLLLLLFLEALVGGLAIFATFAWLRGNEERGQKVATFALVISLVILQPLLFYMQQFAALSGTIMQSIYLLVLLLYRRWYLEGEVQ